MKRGKGYQGDSDDDYMADEAEPRINGTGRQARRTMVAQTPRSAGRSRPTNNQLLYKAYFRWNHYSHKLRNGTAHLPTETDACPSVTAAFLQVLHTLNLAEGYRAGEQRNILQILSNNTRRTKVVELSTGTHRVPDELRKHYLSDGEGGQYSTNLDRNRYGNDDQYLFTVIRYDLEYLGLCPCMVDVEIIDAKNDNQSIFVSAGQEACVCAKMPGFMHDPAYAMQQLASRSRGGVPPIPGLAAPDIAAAAAVMPGTSRGEGGGSPKRSGSQVSLAFDALVMAATGGTEGAAAAQAGGEAPVESRLGGPVAGLQPGGIGSAAAAAAVAAVAGRGSGAGMHQLPSRQRSRLWSALSYGDVDSLQNALDAFRAEEEIASGPGLSDALAGAVAASTGAAPTSSESFRKRSRKPMRGPSATNLAAQMDMLAGMPGMDANLFSSIMKSTGLVSGLRERSGDNTAAQGDVVSSGAVQDGVPRRASSAGPGRSSGSQPPQQQHQRSAPLAAGGSGLRGAGDQIEEAVSQEDDSEPVTGSGRKSSSGGGRGISGKLAGASGGAAGDAVDPVAAAAGDEAGEYDVTAQELGFGAGQVGEVGEEEGEVDEGAGDMMMGDDVDGALADCGPPPGPLAPRRVRHVPRQSSAINLATRVGPAELKRMAAEVEALRVENRLLRQQVGGAAAAAMYAAEGGDGSMQSVLEREIAAMRQQLQEALRAKAAAEDKVMQLQQELIQTRNTANQIVTHAIFNKDASALASARPPNGQQAAAGAGCFGGPQGAGFNPLAALSGQFQNLLAGGCPGNTAAAAAAMAAAMAAAAAAAAGNPAAMLSGSGTISDHADQEMAGLEGKLQQQEANAAAALQAVLAAAAAAGGRGLLQPKAEQSCVASHAEPTGRSDDCKAAADCAPGPAGLSMDEQTSLKADAAEGVAAATPLDAQCSAPAGGGAELAAAVAAETAAAAAAAAAEAEAEAAAAAAGVGESRADLTAAVGVSPIVHEALPVAAMETA